MQIPILTLFASAFVLSLQTVPARAATVSWTGGGDNLSWSNAQNWSSGTVPTSNDDVTIPTGSPGIQISAGVTVKSLNSSRLLVLLSGQLQINGSSALTGGLTLSGGKLLANGSSTVVTASGPISLGASGLEASNGAKLNFPGVTSYTLPAAATVEWKADGSVSSELNFPDLLEITGSASPGNYLRITAGSLGGTIHLPELTTITKPSDGDSSANSGVILKADGAYFTPATCLVSAPKLTTFQDNDPNPNSQIIATTAGVVEAPQLIAPVGVNIINLNAASDPGRFESLLKTKYLTINRGSVAMTNLNTIEGLWEITATDGANVSFPGITSYTLPEDVSVVWEVNGSETSELHFPDLVTITGSASPSKYLSLVAGSSGGVFHLPELTTITKPADGDSSANSGVILKADGAYFTPATCLVSAPKLTTFQDNDPYPNSQITATTTGVVAAPLLIAPVGVNIDLNEASAPGRFASLSKARTLRINRGTVSMHSLNDVNDLSLIEAVDGGKVSLPGVVSYAQAQGVNSEWRANGPAASEINFPNLATLTANTDSDRYFRITTGLHGGVISLPALKTITKNSSGDSSTNSGVIISATGTHGSCSVSAPLLESFHDNDPFPNSQLNASGSGSLTLPSLTSIRGVRWNFGSALTINSGLTFTADGTIPFSVTNNGTLVIPTSGRTLTIQGSLTSSGGIRIIGGATLALTSSLALNGGGLLTLPANSSLQIKGNLLGTTTLTNVGDPLGTLLFHGTGTIATPQQLEAMSRDLGAGQSAFKNNFVYGKLALGSNTRLKLVDLSDNAAGPGAECVYANSVVVPANSVLDLNGIKLYVRASQISGTVVNGTITQVPDSGALTLNTTVPGVISTAGELDEWTFYGRSGTLVTVAVPTGGSNLLSPQLSRAEVSLIDAAGFVLQAVSSSSANATVLLRNITLPEDGFYKVRVRAPASHASSTGNYELTVWEILPDFLPLVVNQSHTGRIETPYSVDTWTFAAAAGQQVRFDLHQSAGSGVVFSLRGPSDWTGFDGIPSDSDLVTLPFAGVYRLSAEGTGGAFDLPYSFRLVETQQTVLTINTAHTGQLVGNGQAQLFRTEVAAGGPMELILQNGGAGNRTELYASRGIPPTRTGYEYASNSGPGASRKVLIPHASAGTWYFLVYGDKVPVPSAYTLEARMTGVALNALSITRQATDVPAQITMTGAGFEPGSLVELISATNEVIAAGNVTVHSPTQLTATFAANAAAAGVYSVRVTRPGGATITLPGGFTYLPSGAPKLETKLIMPTAFGRHAVATIYVEYANTGNASMPAPLLVLKSSDPDGSDRPILTLDDSRIVQHYWSSTSGLPPGSSTEVYILACGAQPGVLNPGERIQVPVHYLGMLQPWDFSDSSVELEIRHWTADDPTPILWNDRKDFLRPPTLDASTWDIVYANLTAGLGTNAAYVSMLNDNAQYLSRLGLRVVDVDDLWNFEIQQAYGYSALPVLDSSTDANVEAPGVPLTISRQFSSNLRSRNATGPFGQGWFTPWQTRLVVERNGDLVKVIGEAGSAQLYSKDIRKNSYFSGAGDSTQMSSIGDGAYELRQPNGSVTRFRADGAIDYMQDANGNRVTAAWTAGRITSLTHSSGGSITLSYGGNGLVSQITESTGRSISYTYQGSYLASATTDDGKVVSYTYETGGSLAVRHALKSVTRAGVTRHFTWDDRGRLEASFLTGGEEMAMFEYDSAGGVSVSQGGGTTSLLFEHRGLLARIVDPLGNITTSEYNSDLRLSRLVLPTGESQSFTWCTCGSPTSITDELGHVTRFSYDHPLKKMTSFTDAKGNLTRYTHDINGNPLNTIYADNSIERLSEYTAAGLPQTQTNRRGQSIQNTWTATGKIDRQTFADGSYADFDYDARGNLAQITEHLVSGPDKITTYTYAHATDGDNLKKVTYPNAKWVEYFYDAVGRRIRMTDSAGGDTRYEYDTAGRLWKLRDSAEAVIVEYLYDAAGRLSRINKGNGTYTTYQYDLAGQILHLINHAPDGTPNSRFDYTYNSRGRRTRVETLDGDWTYEYDATGQLAHAVFTSTNPEIPGQDLRYNYDALGNRTLAVINGVTAEYISNELNQYSAVGGVAQQYDLDGNLIFDGENALEYDTQNRLVSVTGPHGGAEYEYDVFWNRIASVTNGERTEYLLNPTGLVDVLAESKSTSGARYSHGLGLALRNLAGQPYEFYDQDALGSIAGISGENGSYLASYRYTPTGALLGASPIHENPFQFVGSLGVMSAPSGLIFMRARFLDSNTGRFLTLDPIALYGGDNNMYRYARNSPISFVDPTGLTCAKDDTVVNPATLARETGKTIAGIVGFSQWRGGGTLAARIVAGRKAHGNANKVLGNHPMKYLDLVGRAMNGANNPESADGRWLRCDDAVPDESSGHKGGGGEGDKGGDGSGGSAGSFDPNEKIGPGYGSEGWVKADALLPYRINFENLGPGSKDENGNSYPTFATAPAQRVTISDQLEAALDWDTFQITEFGFGDTLISVPAGTSHYTGTVTTTYNGKTFRVEMEAGIDFSAGRIFVVYQSLDPNTELPPDILTGFLPPEDGTGRGMGHFSYTIRTRADLPASTQIRNVAYIKFDINETIATDQVNPQDASQGIDPNRQALVTLDPDAPVSSIDALAVSSRTASFAVRWTGSDVGAGVRSYDIYVSDDGGPWQLWLSGTSGTSAIFEGEHGHTYGFLSVAHDHAGNIQELGSVAQATVTIVPIDGRGEKSIAQPNGESTAPDATPIDDWASDWNSAGVAIYDGLLRDPTDGEPLIGAVERLSVSPPAATSGLGGSLSATIRLRGRTFTIRGAFDSQGQFEKSFVQSDGTSLEVNLRLMKTANGHETIRGSVTWNGASGMADLPRAPYSIGNPAPVGLVSSYTAIFPSRPNWGFDEPGGDGWATVSVSSAGVVTFMGRLGDGTSFTEVAYLSAEAEISLYAELYRTVPENGRFGGRMVFRNQVNVSDLDGLMQWRKFPDGRESRYSNGFDIDVWALGSRFEVPQAPTTRVLSALADQDYNAELSFFGPTAPGADPVGLDRVVSWQGNNRLIHYGPEKLRGSASSRSGALTGSFFDPATKTTIGFTGVAFQKQAIAAGVFVNGSASGSLRILPGTTFDYPGSENPGPLAPIQTPTAPANDPAKSDTGNLNPAAAGRFQGILVKDGQISGALETVTLTTSGVVSGVLWIEGIRYNFRGSFLTDGTASIPVSRQAGMDPIDLQLTLAALDGDAGGFGLRGAATIDGVTHGVDAQRRPDFTKTNRSPHEGAYTLVFRAPDGVDPTAEPGGDGAGTLYVSVLGDCSGLVVLADGTKLTMAGHTGMSYDDHGTDTAEWSFHRGLYGRVPKGFLAGKLAFRETAGVSDLDGRWRWNKQDGAAPSAIYPSGFNVTREVVGSFYRPPGNKSRAMHNLDDDFHNIWLRFSGPDLSVLDTLTVTELNRTATWTSTNRVLYYGPERGALTFNARTGKLTGSFRDSPQGVRVIFQGVLLQDRGLASGAYLSQGKSGVFSVQPRRGS